MNKASLTHLAALGSHLSGLGQALSALSVSLAEPTAPTVAPSMAEHYSQAAKDARQEPVLALFHPLDKVKSLPWKQVFDVALEHGYGPQGAGGLLSGLLEWADLAKTKVRITFAGQQRYAEIQARKTTAG